MIVAANWAGICRAQQLATISEMHRQETDCYRNSPGSAGREVTVYWQCCIWDVGWNVDEVFSPLLPARSKGTAVFFNEIVGVAWVKPASIWSSTVCFTLQLALICSSSAVFLQYLVHELEWLSGPPTCAHYWIHSLKLRGILNVAAGRWILVWLEPPRWSCASRRDRTFGVWTRQDPRNSSQDDSEIFLCFSNRFQ